MRRLKDRDFLRTVEDFLFCVVGYLHPHDRVLSYLKYVPSSDGQWGRGGERYTRTMPNYTIPSLLSNIEILRKNFPKYVFHSKTFNIQMSAVPHGYIAERYFPEVKLQELFASTELDPLQEATVELVSQLSEESGVSKCDFGVTGSLLTDIHSCLFSDIDLTVYGNENAWKVRMMLEQKVGNPFLRKSSEKERIVGRWVKNYPLTIREAEAIYALKWNYGSFKDRSFSIHAVRKEKEIVERYGESLFSPEGIVEGSAEVKSVDESLFLPCTYKVRGLTVKRETGTLDVDDVVSYDGFYSGLFEPGQRILVKGKLEEVNGKDGSRRFRVLVGSPEAMGGDYIKPNQLQ